MTGSHIADCYRGERPITPCKSSCKCLVIRSLLSFLRLGMPRDRSPLRGAPMTGVGKRGAYCLLDAVRFLQLTLIIPSNMRTSIILVAFVAALIECSRLTPPVLPLLVRNPYLSIWLPNVRQNQPWAHWPMFWTGESIGFSVLANLPASSTIYPLLGRPQDSLPVNRYVSPPQQPH
jgi:hypothetical protein